MSGTHTAAKQQPPSPPHSNDGDFDLSAIQQHIDSVDPQSVHPHIRPTPLVEQFIDQYGDPSEYQTAAPHMYYPSQPGFHRTNPPATPPTTGYDNVMRTRSGRSLGSPLTSTNPETSRRSRSPKAKAKRAPRNAKASSRAVELLEPLSVMTKDWTVPLGDIEAKVHRSAEQRQGEVNNKKNNGKVPRPMNSFMLYRSAYAERVKEYCKEGNHQIISQITGASWAMEPPKIKELYESYADIDRQNHQKAHPDYKFAPNKNGPASRKRKGRDDEEQTDWDDREYGAGSSHSKRTRYNQSVGSRSHTSTPFDARAQPSYGAVPISHHAHPSSYHASNPRSVPPMYPTELDDHYYEQWATSYGDNVEDIHVRRVQHPSTIYYAPTDDGSLVGLPQNGHGEVVLRQQGGRMPHPGHLHPIDPVDPRLEHFEQHRSSDGYAEYEEVPSLPPLEPQFGYGQGDPFAGTQYVYPEGTAHPGNATLTAPQGSWDSPLPGADFDEEFGKWPP